MRSGTEVPAAASPASSERAIAIEAFAEQLVLHFGARAWDVVQRQCVGGDGAAARAWAEIRARIPRMADQGA